MSYAKRRWQLRKVSRVAHTFLCLDKAVYELMYPDANA